MNNYHVFTVRIWSNLGRDQQQQNTAIGLLGATPQDMRSKLLAELKRDIEATITSGSHVMKVQKRPTNLGRHGLQMMHTLAGDNLHLNAVFFDRGGDVAMQILPSAKYPEAPYKAAETAEGIGFGFDYIDLLGNYRAADGSLIFRGPADPQVMQRADGTVAFSGPRNPDP